MRPTSSRPARLIAAMLASVGAALLVAPPASAASCYVVLDRNDTVIFQGTRPPVDMSAAGASAREAMRHRGEFIELFDSPTCPERSASSAAGKGEASVDEIVAGIKPYQRVSRRGAPSDEPTQAFVARDDDRVAVPVN